MASVGIDCTSCPEEVDCMACLVNLARGLENALGTSMMTEPIKHKGIRHAAISRTGVGGVQTACNYERVGGAPAVWRVVRHVP